MSTGILTGSMRYRVSRLTAQLPLLALGLGVVTEARAQVTVGANLELGTLFASETAGTLSTFSPVAGLSLGFSTGSALRFRLPLVVGSFSNVGVLAAVGNPELAFGHTFGSEALSVEPHISFTAPAAQAQDQSEHSNGFWRIARGAAATARGLYDPQLWVESSASILGGVSLRTKEGAIFGAVHADAGALLEDDPRLMVQGAVEAGVRITDWFELGLRLQIVGLTKSEEGPRIICIARTAEECNGRGAGSFDNDLQLFQNGRLALSEDVVVASIIPGVRFLLPPVELRIGLTLNFSDIVALGAEGAAGPGLLISAILP